MNSGPKASSSSAKPNSWAAGKCLTTSAEVVEIAADQGDAIPELLDSGASLRDAQDFARHKDPRTTRKYDHGRGNLDRHGSYALAARYGRGRSG